MTKKRKRGTIQEDVKIACSDISAAIAPNQGGDFDRYLIEITPRFLETKCAKFHDYDTVRMANILITSGTVVSKMSETVKIGIRAWSHFAGVLLEHQDKIPFDLERAFGCKPEYQTDTGTLILHVKIESASPIINTLGFMSIANPITDCYQINAMSISHWNESKNEDYLTKFGDDWQGLPIFSKQFLASGLTRLCYSMLKTIFFSVDDFGEWILYCSSDELAKMYVDLVVSNESRLYPHDAKKMLNRLSSKLPQYIMEEPKKKLSSKIADKRLTEAAGMKHKNMWKYEI